MFCSFIKQLKSVSWTTFVFFLAAPALSQDSKTEAKPSMTLMEFTQPSDKTLWIAVNDGVMGGLSQGGAKIDSGVLHFSGTLSLENNGGFSSIRTTGSGFDLSTAKCMVLRIKGDGRTYQLRLSTNARFRDSRISYGAEFATQADTWMEVRIDFSTLKPRYRGTKLDGPPLDLSKVEEIGLLIGDKRAGDFLLQVDWMKAE